VPAGRSVRVNILPVCLCDVFPIDRAEVELRLTSTTDPAVVREAKRKRELLDLSGCFCYNIFLRAEIKIVTYGTYMEG